ncbi:hypothetical protein FIA58_003425 [Flavobacterium jejuense]|uniref:Uncharacterized protein n=1 Tax=Flavobacterium jejuense TaxID=1544455 RepID=A0ABX0IP54_9FLAO|nr:hypothetical protein [Flavobacterium jejuense]NHN24717.1 hypothetical protein [Flavobacterium jejuense]
MSFSQSKNEIEADFEMQTYFKNYSEFNLDSLKKKKFKAVKEIESLRTDFEFERVLDGGIKESIYNIVINFVDEHSFKDKEYKVHIFKKNNSIFGLINYDAHRKKKNQYFEEEKLDDYLQFHNIFYQTNFNTTDFVSQVLENLIYSYYCGYGATITKVPEYNNLKFNKKKNRKTFTNWLKSFNPELQTYGLDALLYLEKNKGIQVTELEKKLIANIKNRNSVLNTCSGCEMGIYEKVFE